ncbi:MAG: MotA/TolQ/ExbB proton channel family protein, partial [Gammaproteobacteria bacterium]
MKALRVFQGLALSLLMTLAGTALSAEAEEAAETQAGAPDESPTKEDLQPTPTMEDLLELIREGRLHENDLNRQREAQFVSRRQDQQRLLDEAKAERRRLEQRADQLETQFEENEIKIGDLQEALDKRLVYLRELFGVLLQVSGDTRGLFAASVISTQFPGRGKFLGELAAKMGKSTELASIEEMERLWYELQREMIESGKIVTFPSRVTMADGETRETNVTRVGSFNVVADGDYLDFTGETLVELPRQPSGRFTSTVSDLEEAEPGELVPQAATLEEQVGTLFSFAAADCYLPFCDGQGGYVGSVIILGGILGVLLAIERLITLSMIGARVAAQTRSDHASDDNPLGRVLRVYEENKDVDVDTLELKLSEAILGEQPKLTRNITLIQVISVVAPLLGLLGTVIGMIITFQAITLFGTGDPKTMAGGISTALMTTVLGLCVAIPTV